MRKEIIEQAHPGVTIREDILPDLGMSVNQLAKAIGVTPSRLNDVVLLAPGSDGGYRIAPGAQFRHDSGVLDEPAGKVRSTNLAAQHESGKKIEKAVKRGKQPDVAVDAGLGKVPGPPAFTVIR